MPNILVSNNSYVGTSSACVVDLVPPTFAGINFIDVESRGQIRVAWPAGVDTSNPIRYEIYVQVSTATGLFSTANIAGMTSQLQYDIFTLADGSYMQNGSTYYVGIRAVDAVGNRDANTVSLSVISTGILTSIDVYEAKAAWSTNQSNQFVLTAWATKDSSRANAPTAVMGPASYQVFRKDGTALAGMSGSSASPNAEGLYVFSPIANLLLTTNEHYEIRVSVTVDGEARVNFHVIEEPSSQFSIAGTVDFDIAGKIVGSFWAKDASGIVTQSLGTATWQLYTAEGIYTGIHSGLYLAPPLTADVNGFFRQAAFTLPGPVDSTQAYVVRLILNVAGETITDFIIVGNDPMQFETRAVFSINASNQFEGTFWALRNREHAPFVALGTASYTLYDKAGVAVAGFTQSGLTPDAQGYYHITPVSAALITDLTHYKAKVTIVVQGSSHSSTHAFTLLGT